MDAGSMRDGITVLELTQTAGGYAWEPVRADRAKADLPGKTNIFSKNGLGARTVVLTMRHDPGLTLHNAIEWRQNHLFLTSITPIDRMYDEVGCALVKSVECQAEVNHTPPGATFPAALTEKYVSHDQLDPLAINTTIYVLVVPKAVTLKRGSLVEVDGVPYEVLLGHFLDEYKNEYEILRVEDL